MNHLGCIKNLSHMNYIYNEPFMLFQGLYMFFL